MVEDSKSMGTKKCFDDMQLGFVRYDVAAASPEPLRRQHVGLTHVFSLDCTCTCTDLRIALHRELERCCAPLHGRWKGLNLKFA